MNVVPAGNTSLAAALVIAQKLDRDRIVIVQETEYTGAGKHPLAQLNFAKKMGIQVVRGDPRNNEPGKAIVIPQHPAQLGITEIDLDQSKQSYLRNALHALPPGETGICEADISFLATETRSDQAYVRMNFSKGS